MIEVFFIFAFIFMIYVIISFKTSESGYVEDSEEYVELIEKIYNMRTRLRDRIGAYNDLDQIDDIQFRHFNGFLTKPNYLLRKTISDLYREFPRVFIEENRNAEINELLK